MNYIAFLFTAASIVGTLANSFQKKWCFYIWLCTNSFWCVYNTINAQYAQALLYVFNLATCIIGLYKWRRPVRLEVHHKEPISPQNLTPDISTMQVLTHEEHDRIHTFQKADGLRADVAIIDEPKEAEKPSKEIEDPYTRISKALADLSTALIDVVRPTLEALTDVFFKFAKTYCNGDYEFLKWQYDNADPRLLHRAYNAKRYRTRKKNLARLHREYKKYIKKGGGRK